MRGSTREPRLDALADRLSCRIGVPREVAAAVVFDEAERLGSLGGGALRQILVKRGATRRLREIRMEEEVEHEVVATDERRNPDQVAMGAWRRDTWLE